MVCVGIDAREHSVIEIGFLLYGKRGKEKK
jgi:hypothetical protein